MRHVPAVCSALCGVLLGSSARADPRSEPTIALGFDVAYDSNVYNGRGPDWVTRVAPRLAWRLRDRRAELDLGYDLGLWAYLNDKADHSINHRATARLAIRASRRLSLTIADELVRAADPGYLSRAGVVAPQTGILDNFLDGSASFRFSRRVEGSLGYTYHLTRFEALPPPSPPLYDGDEHQGRLAVTWRATRRDDLRFSQRLQYFEVDGEPFALAEGPGLGWRHQVARPIELRIEGGPLFYQTFDASRRLGREGTGITWFASGTLRVSAYPWRAALSAVRDLVGGTGAGSVLWADYLTLQIGHHFHHSVEARGAVSIFSNGFAPTRERRYDGLTVDASLGGRPLPFLHVALYYAFRVQETAGHDAFADVTRHVVGIRLVAEATSRREVKP